MGLLGSTGAAREGEMVREEEAFPSPPPSGGGSSGLTGSSEPESHSIL